MLSIKRFNFQFPTMDEMTEGEKNFALKVEEFLSSVPKPEYRQLLVEVCWSFFFSTSFYSIYICRLQIFYESEWSVKKYPYQG